MAFRGSTLQRDTTTAISEKIDSRYDLIIKVSEHLDQIAEILAMDLDTLLIELQTAADFRGLTVENGEAGWDSVNKVLTVPTVQGKQGVPGYNGLTPSYEFTYNSITGNLEYTLVEYISLNDSHSVIEEW